MSRPRPSTIHPIDCACQHCSPPWQRYPRPAPIPPAAAIGAAIGALPLLHHFGPAILAALSH